MDIQRIVPDWSWQNEAIEKIINNYKANNNSSGLIVIPTGGGKTLTAIRAINRMLNQKIISINDEVIWITHLKTLYENTRESLESEWKFLKDPLDKKHKKLKNVIKIKMKVDGEKYVSLNSKNIKVIIIDEAHHSSEGSYSKFFQYSHFVLGLTATPHRRDKKNLKYDDIMYQISPIELFQKNVLVRPKFWKQLDTGIKIDVNNLEKAKSKELFNLENRNELIANFIMDQSEILKRLIIYVGTKKHVRSIYKILKSKNKFYNKYDYISYVLGGDDNPSFKDYGVSLSNYKYLDRNANYDKYIIVNCGVLTEGYDDPRITSIVMGTPTSSIVYFMQCIGRALRFDKINSNNTNANIITVDDDLPNIKYRINNEWLFQSISDELEPVVKSIEFDSENELIKKLGLLSTDLNIDNIKISYKDLSEVEKYNLFFYNYSSKLKNDAWNILILNEENKNNFLNMYNTFSSKIGSYLKSNENLKNRFKLILGENNIVGLDSHNSIINFIETIENAYNDIISNKINKRIIYYSFNFEELYPKDLEIFLIKFYTIYRLEDLGIIYIFWKIWASYT